MLIAIDFDDTLTADAELWREFVYCAEKLGHVCVCVTARRDTEENFNTVGDWMRAHGFNLPMYFTSLKSKVEYMESHGHSVDVWIDDNPVACAWGH